MQKETWQNYIISGSEKKFRFNSQDFKLKPGKKRKISRNKEGGYRVDIDKNLFEGEVLHRKQNKYTVKVNGNTYQFLIDREESFKRKAALAASRGEDRVYTLKSPMPGKIREIFVSKGSEVKKGEPLLILEAMKMQNQVLASEDAKVVGIHIKKDDTVLRDQILVELERK